MSPSQLAPDPFLPGGTARGSPRRAAAAADILFRLPALYRESPGAMLPLAQAIADTAAWLADEVSRWIDSPLEGGSAGGRARGEAGTTRSLLSFLSRDGPPPAIWPGVTVRPVKDRPPDLTGLGAGAAPEEVAEELEIRPSSAKCAVVAWPAGTPAERADPARIPAALLPAGLSLQVVILEGAEPAFRIAGERFRGRVQQ